MIDLVILCPLALEYEAMRQHLIDPQRIKSTAWGRSYELGQMTGAHGQWKVALMETGKGVEDLQAITQTVLYHLQPLYLFLVGVAGGIKDVGIGDVVVATEAYGYQWGKVVDGEIVVRPKVIPHSSGLLDLAKQLAHTHNRDKKNHRIHFGPIISGNMVIADRKSELYQRIKKHYNDTLAVEMEAIGFAKAASLTAVQHLNIRGISDLIDNKATTDQDGFQEMAAARAADFVQNLLAQLPTPHHETLPAEQQTAWNKAQSLKVRYAWQPFSSWGYRSFQTATLLLQQGIVQLILPNTTVDLSSLQHLEYFRMPGDFSKSWIKVTYLDQQHAKTLYLSSAIHVAGFSAIFGGSQPLLEELQKQLTNAQLVNRPIRKSY
ncbi:MAG: 5'-methylthioadenosine/S-adenosylhomocysteine nucleosidase [Bacteroidota bacterium]